ncbi:polysaccharide deacetylase family protein [Micromonospora sp. BRA006-A]|nr:polysaccharide deacetylase family protein [Micromonospora sp. BRA006-A]
MAGERAGGIGVPCCAAPRCCSAGRGRLFATAESTWVADRRLPIAGGPASATLGNRHQEVGTGGLQVVWGVRTEEPLVALTFDDGPRPQWTPMVLDTLAEHRVPATFFLVGERAREHAALVRGRMDAHEVGNHSWAHRDLARMDAATVYDDLWRSHDAITAATGSAPRLLRPPWGHLGGSVLYASARLGYRLVLWTLQMVESEFPHDPAGHARRIVADVRPERSCSATTSATTPGSSRSAACPT